MTRPDPTRVEPEELAFRGMVRRAPEGQSSNGVIRELVDALRLLSAGQPGPAVDLLDAACRRQLQPLDLTDREYAEILGWCGVVERECQRCDQFLTFVATGPDPGWWRHGDEPADPPHGAVPVVVR